MLEDEPDVGAELARRGGPGVEAVDHHAATEVAPTAVRNQSIQAAEQRRLTAPRRPTNQNDVPGVDPGGEVGDHRLLRLRVAEGQAVKRDQRQPFD